VRWVVFAGQGTYTVNPATGTVTCSPVPGYTGSPPPVGYRVLDSAHQVALGAIEIVYRSAVPAAHRRRPPPGPAATAPRRCPTPRSAWTG
jgi:hypothetical protein